MNIINHYGNADYNGPNLTLRYWYKMFGEIEHHIEYEDRNFVLRQIELPVFNSTFGSFMSEAFYEIFK